MLICCWGRNDIRPFCFLEAIYRIKCAFLHVVFIYGYENKIRGPNIEPAWDAQSSKMLRADFYHHAGRPQWHQRGHHWIRPASPGFSTLRDQTWASPPPLLWRQDSFRGDPPAGKYSWDSILPDVQRQGLHALALGGAGKEIGGITDLIWVRWRNPDFNKKSAEHNKTSSVVVGKKQTSNTVVVKQ